jgi:predicted lactoylglutathione lyase
MANKQIFVNLPVKNLPASRKFFDALGYTFNPDFSNDDAACMVISEEIYVMLLVEKFFATFTKKPIADAKQSTEVLICLSADSRADVDAMVAKARQAGGSVTSEPQDYGFMYGHGFADLDGHQWEVMYMEPGGKPS